MGGTTLSSLRIRVDERTAVYRAGGEGPPVLFLHGWAMGTRAYQQAVRRLTGRGCRVYAPAMPGFAGTADLPRDVMSMSGYGDWVDRFMDAVAIDEPALVIGHSFGGGVAIKLAQTHPERVGYLVLLNSVGGVSDRPVWSGRGASVANCSRRARASTSRWQCATISSRISSAIRSDCSERESLHAPLAVPPKGYGTDSIELRGGCAASFSRRAPAAFRPFR